MLMTCFGCNNYSSFYLTLFHLICNHVSESATLRALRALVPYMPSAPRAHTLLALVLYVPLAVRTLVLTCLVPHMLSCLMCYLAPRASCPSYVYSCLTCLMP